MSRLPNSALTRSQSRVICERACDVGLDDETSGAVLPDHGQGVVGRRRVLIIVNGDVDATLRQLERDPAADATRATRDQGVFALEYHTSLPS